MIPERKWYYFKRKYRLDDDVPMAARITASVITTLFAVSALLPLLLVISISFTDEQALKLHGYNFIPAKFSLEGYSYVLNNARQIFVSYGVTITTTVSGVILGLLIMTMFSYSLSRKSFVLRRPLSFMAVFTMLFSGGMLSQYIINTQVLHLKDTFAALVLPSCVSTMYIMILRSYMENSIPASVIESAKIDGAGEFLCYWKLVIPMAVPSIATVALFMSVAFWNAWYQAFLYIVNNKSLVPIQLLLKRIENEIQYLAQNSGNISGGEAMVLQANIPSESVKMCLVVLVVVPILIAYPFFQKYFVKGITLGAVKE